MKTVVTKHLNLKLLYYVWENKKEQVKGSYLGHRPTRLACSSGNHLAKFAAAQTAAAARNSRTLQSIKTKMTVPTCNSNINIFIYKTVYGIIDNPFN